MKKTAAIILTALLCVNLFGYRIVFSLAAHYSDTKLETSIDKVEYDEDELVTVKIPLNNPYNVNQSTFERIDGEVTLEGKLYKYVKRRIFNNELILLCLPNHDKMRIEEEKKNYFENTNDIALHKNSGKQENSKAGVIKNPVTEYERTFSANIQHEIITAHTNTNSFINCVLSPGYLLIIGEPPRLV